MANAEAKEALDIEVQKNPLVLTLCVRFVAEHEQIKNWPLHVFMGKLAKKCMHFQ